MLRASDIMREKIVTCYEDHTVADAAEIMLKEGVGSVLVKKGAEVVGIVTKNDILRSVLGGKDVHKTYVREIMSSPVETCDADDTLEEILRKFEGTKYSRLVVKKNGKIVGVVRRKIAERFMKVSVAHDLVSRRLRT